jgi:phosphoserine phosphatase RsbU/P
LKTDFSDWKARFEGFTSRFSERAAAAPPPKPPCDALRDDYWTSVQDLFTRDVTRRGFGEMVQNDTQETLRFFAKNIDLERLRPLPWYQRWPITAWQMFLAMAYRLSPPRRLLFAIAVPLVTLGWLRMLLRPRGGSVLSAPHWPSWEGWLVMAGSMLFLLLLLELRDKLSLKGDLEIARQIQFGLVPAEAFTRQDFVVQASMRPANTVGGDYYDVIELGEGRFAIAVGDVAGKGMPAALLMAMLQGSLRTLISAGFRGSDLIAKLNAHLYANIPSNRLVTFFYAQVDPAAGTLQFINAGHNPPFVLRADGSLDRLDSNAVALGILPDAPFPSLEISLAAGERLFLYTDGVTEAFNPQDEEYGEDRLIAFLAKSRDVGHEALIESLKESVLAFSAPARPRDDMTLMVVAREAEHVVPPPLPTA